MNEIYRIDSVNDYARYVGAPEISSLVSVVHYNELGEVRNCTKSFGVYGIFLLKGEETHFSHSEGSLVAVSPGQESGLPDDGKCCSFKGWALLFDPQLVRGTVIENRLESYRFLTYNKEEALRLAPTESRVITTIIKLIRNELIEHSGEAQTRQIIVAYIQLILEYCSRYHNRQFAAEETNNKSIISRFRNTLEDYYNRDLQFEFGTPSVKYCAEQLYLSANYFGDLVKSTLGITAVKYIRSFVIDRAKTLLLEGKPISETAYELGFEYPQHFTRVFKSETGMLPSEFIKG